MRFFNSMQNNMSFADVVASIKYFIKANTDSKYRLAVGTDSQVKGRYIMPPFVKTQEVKI